MNSIELNQLNSWINGLPIWLRYGASLLLERNNLEEKDINEITDICLKRKQIDNISLNLEIILKPSISHTFHLVQISNIKGVNNLSPRKPLDFGEANLSIVYGANGSGKSGYIRLLKNVSNSRKKNKILGNVFSKENIEPSASIKYKVDDTEKEISWTESIPMFDLHYIDIYDTNYTDLFLKDASVVSYEPPLLDFFSKLIKLMDDIHRKIESEISSKTSSLPIFPIQYQTTCYYNWFKSLSEKTVDIDDKCNFTKEDERRLAELNSRLAEQNPADKERQYRNYISQLDKLITDLTSLNSLYSVATSNKIQALIKDYQSKKDASEAMATELKSNTLLDGLGTDSWKELWHAAKKYSETVAYRSHQFPYLNSDARCVLCHQPLGEESKNRFISFDEYIKGETERAYQQSKKTLEEKINGLIEIDNDEKWNSLFIASSITDEKLIKEIFEIINKFREKRKTLINKKELTSNENISNILTILNSKKIEYKKEVEKYKQDAIKQNREELQQQQTSLNTKKWLAENKESIKNEIERLKAISRLQNCKAETNTRIVSTKRGELSTKLITEDFVKRFNTELKFLNSKVSVSFKRENIQKDKVLHRVVLNNAKQAIPLNEILSEGEYRIVALAAFLADVSGRTGALPFVFDDPITSLDQFYEESVAKRLTLMAKERQVIIFTHRLSFMSLLQSEAKTHNLDSNLICIQKENWGAGEPSTIPINMDKPDKTLNRMITEDIKKLETIYSKQGNQEYYPFAKSLCSDFRILLERMIECYLLCDVVQRFRRAIQTQGKLFKVAKIKDEDCKLFDDLMTKYSRFEHSQPPELQIDLPSPDEFLNDMTKLKDWYCEFKKR